MDNIKRMNYDDTDYNGNTWPRVWVDTYNGLTDQLERAVSLGERERVMNERHAFFVICVATARLVSENGEV
jgi:hypothetical protein